MRIPRRLLAAGAVLASAVLLFPVGPTPAVAAGRSDSVTLAVIGMSPSTPAPSQTLNPLTVELALTNTTDKPITGVRILGERGDPINRQDLLDKSIGGASPSPSGGLDVLPTHPVTVDLPAHGHVTVNFPTTTGIPTNAGICLCAQGGAIYPLFFSAHVDGPGGVDQRLGVVTTYLPAFYEKPAPLHVGWLWPLIDQPHRLFGSTVFTDDLLAGSLASPDGRLSRALDVVEQVGRGVPLTLMVDPELLDEVEVMATQQYTVISGDHTVPGLGQAAATAWLARLRGVLSSDAGVQVELTPYADPDVQSLSTHGLPWDSTLPADMIPRVSDALAGRPLDTTVAWPAAGGLDQTTLDTLQQDGVSTVVLNGTAVLPRSNPAAVPSGLARLQSNGTDVAAALTSATIQKYVASAITAGGTGTAALPRLVAELATRAAQEPTAEHAVIIAAPRYVNPSVSAAVRAIKDTSISTFAEPVSLRTAVSGQLLPTGRSRLAKVPRSVASLPAQVLSTGTEMGTEVPAISALLDQANDEAATALLTSLPIGLQRAESSAWRGEQAGAPGADFAEQLIAKIDSVTAGVKIVRPSSGSYTLASSSSPLPITVENDHDYAVRVRIRVSTTVNGLPGFTTKDIGVQRVDGKSKRTLHLPTKIEHSGRIKVDAVLLTPNDFPLGAPVPLTVRSTALGVIGVVITIAAGVVLALALLIRLARRFRKRGSGKAPTPVGDEPGPAPDPVVAGELPATPARPADDVGRAP